MKQRINFIIDILMFLFLAAMTGIGFLMKYILIPGKDRFAKYGVQADLYFLHWDRHEWGTVHLIIGFVMLALLALHIILHWKSVVCLFRLLINNKPWRISLAIVFSLLCLFLVVFPFMVNIELDVTAGQGHHRMHNTILEDPSEIPAMPDSGTTTRAEPPRSALNLEQKNHDSHDHHNGDIRIYGSMTIQQVSDIYKIPVDSIITGLGIDPPCSPNEKFGHLRKRFSFRMTDVENIVCRYRAK